jgi:hypothetical protein
LRMPNPLHRLQQSFMPLSEPCQTLVNVHLPKYSQ